MRVVIKVSYLSCLKVRKSKGTITAPDSIRSDPTQLDSTGCDRTFTLSKLQATWVGDFDDYSQPDSVQLSGVDVVATVRTCPEYVQAHQPSFSSFSTFLMSESVVCL